MTVSYNPNFAGRCAAVPAAGTLTVRTGEDRAGAARAIAETAGLVFSEASAEAGSITMTFTRP